VHTVLLTNGANGTLVFDGTDGMVIKGRLLLKQPASGSAGTVVWPSNVVWSGGAATVLATTSGYVDDFDCLYLPAENQWRITHLGTYHA
jgi:hypothetical protein